MQDRRIAGIVESEGEAMDAGQGGEVSKTAATVSRGASIV